MLTQDTSEDFTRYFTCPEALQRHVNGATSGLRANGPTISRVTHHDQLGAPGANAIMCKPQLKRPATSRYGAVSDRGAGDRSTLLRFAFILLVSVLVVALPSVGFAADGKVRVFDGGMSQVFDATMKAIEKNWKKAQSSDRAAGTIQFHTGVSLSTWGEDCIAVLRDLGNGKIEVSLKSKNSAQLYAWGRWRTDRPKVIQINTG